MLSQVFFVSEYYSIFNLNIKKPFNLTLAIATGVASVAVVVFVGGYVMFRQE
ncbi:MAG: hypothetical protein OEV85_03805 [Candidatus Thorarchaeota archaeon]|nr:hypothetical protein [Candidatus Thorarchaeota archaeon]